MANGSDLKEQFYKDLETLPEEIVAAVSRFLKSLKRKNVYREIGLDENPILLYI